MRTGQFLMRCVTTAAIPACWALSAVAALRVTETDTTVTVESAHYVAVVAKDRGMTLRSLTDRRTKRVMRVLRAGLVVNEERERPTWTGAAFGQSPVGREADASAAVEVERGVGVATIRGTWSTAAVDVRKTLTFAAESAVIEITYRVHIKRPLEQLSYMLDVNDVSLSERGRFQPGGKRHVARMPTEADFQLAPAYTYCTDGQAGVGILASADAGVRAVAHMICPPSRKCIHLAAYSRPLRWAPLPGDVELGLGVVVGLPSTAVAALHRSRNPDLPAVEIAELNVKHLIQRTGEPGRATAVLTSNSSRTQRVVLTAQVTEGVATQRKLQPRSLSLEPGEAKIVPLEWENWRDYGGELLVRVHGVKGDVLDSAREYFAVADHFVKVAQTTVWNPGWMRYDWLTPAMVKMARDNYVGIIEYYCWAPDQVFDLTPDTESWEPHTESQGAYRTQLTRTFLRGVVEAAHAGGLRVLAMDTGFAGLPGALDHPERIKYTPDGQMYLYNGNIHDGKRFCAVGAYLYEPDLVRAWAEEMCASVEMFGWDGVRFDWNFIPIAPQDPLHMAAAGKRTESIYESAQRQAWYTWDGRSAHDLFPDPDRTGAELCAIYRRTVAAKHPDFIYNVNYSVNHGLLEKYPEYSKVNTTDAGILMESLLNTCRTYPTWQAWAKFLTDALSRVRPRGAQPFVGWMRGYAPGGIAHRNMQFIMMASGFRWYGPYGARHSLDDTSRRFRHALRFAEFFYDPGFQRIEAPGPRVRVTGPGADRVLWKPFVFERVTPGRRELLVHLLNLPENDHIIMHHEVPSVKRDLVVSLKWRGPPRPTACRLMVPEPRPRTVKLSWKTGPDGAVIVRIPELRSLGSLLLSGGESN